MDAFVPIGGAGSTSKVQEVTATAGVVDASITATLPGATTNGNMLIAVLAYRGTGTSHADPSGWTKHADVQGPSFDGGRLILYSRLIDAGQNAVTIGTSAIKKALYLAEWAGPTAFDTDAETDNHGAATTMVTPSLSPGVTPALLFAGFNQSARNPSIALQAPFTEDYDHDVDASGPSVVFGHRIVDPASGSYTATAISNQTDGYGAFLASFDIASGGVSWVAAPDTIDANDGTSDDVSASTIGATSGVFWRADVGTTIEAVGELTALIGFDTAGAATVLLQGGDNADWSDSLTTIEINLTATGSLTGDELHVAWEASEHRYWKLVLDSAADDLRVYEVALVEAEVFEEPEPGKAILEIYVHDEDASRWGEATWATGAATGTEGIWSAAGWTDVTPEGVNVHWIWGSRRPSRGILHDQDGASVNIQTYDPDRVLDPGNPDSPYYPQLVPNLPVRVSHESLVIRTGLVEELTWSAKDPYYQGQMLGTDTIGPLHRAGVPADSILGDTLLERIQDAVNAAGISVGGIPLPPAGPSGPALSEYVEGAATDDDVSVWEIIRKACQEVLWVPYVTADAGLGLRPWGSPLDRGREITATNLEDNKSTINEDGTYSVVSVQVADPDLDPIIRVAAPLPRYGRRMYERRETTIDPEGWASAVLADRAWPGVQYIPGAIHCFTAADVNYFGSLETMERVTITVPGVVSVQGRILGGELWVEHRKGSERGATWVFLFSVATDGSTAIGLDTLVSDQSGEPLVDDMTETDFLEAD